MKKSFMLALGLAAAMLSSKPMHADYTGPYHVDGSQFEDPAYGSVDTLAVVNQVKAQEVAYHKAAKAADQAYKDWTKVGEAAPTPQLDKLRDLQAACIRLASLSYVKAMYAAEMGRIAQRLGDTVTASANYQDALKYAQAAQQIADQPDWAGSDGQNVPEKSKEQGAKFEAIARKHLDQMAVAVGK